jgi:hypothetical protein
MSEVCDRRPFKTGQVSNLLVGEPETLCSSQIFSAHLLSVPVQVLAFEVSLKINYILDFPYEKWIDVRALCYFRDSMPFLEGAVDLKQSLVSGG